jgi:hypothetical protein
VALDARAGLRRIFRENPILSTDPQAKADDRQAKEDDRRGDSREEAAV